MSINSSIENIHSLTGLSSDFNRLLDNNRLFSDAVLLCDGVEIPVHKCILSVRSPVFAVMFQSPMQEGLSGVVNIVNIKLNVLEAMLRYVYSGKIGCPFDDFADELYGAADLYGLDSLKQICTDKLKSILCRNNMFDILRFGDLHNETLKMRAIEFICNHELSAMEETEEWKSLEEGYPRLTIEVMKSIVKRSKDSSHKRKRDEHEIVIQFDKGVVALDVNATDTVRDIKEKIQDIQGIAIDEQTLYVTTLLQDSKTLADFVIQEHSSLSLVHIFEICVNDFNRLLNNNLLFSDAVLLCDGVEIPVHKCILSVRSPVFAAMFQSRMQEGLSGVVNIVDIKLNVLEAMLRYIYTGKIGPPFDDFADDLYVAADLYGLDSLKQICTNKLKSILSWYNMFDILRFGDLHNETLKMHAIEFICNHRLSDMEETEKWKSLEEEYPRLTIEVMKSIVKRSNKDTSPQRKRNENEIVIQCDGGNIALDADARDTVRDMKKKIQDVQGIAIDEQMLYVTTLLQDSKTLADCEIQEHSSLSLVHIFKLCVKTCTGKNIPLEVKKSYSIEEVKKMFLDKEGIPVYLQCLVFNGQRLQDSKSLASYNITNDSTLYHILKLRG